MVFSRTSMQLTKATSKAQQEDENNRDEIFGTDNDAKTAIEVLSSFDSDEDTEWVSNKSSDRGGNEYPLCDEGLRVQIDIVEYWCHKIMDGTTGMDIVGDDETNVVENRRRQYAMIERTYRYSRELSRSLQQLPKSKHYGRLYNRLIAASLVGDVCSASSIPTRDSNDNNPLCYWSLADWIQIRERIIILKSSLLRRDANALPENATDDGTKEDDSLDDEISKQRIYTEDFESLMSLLDVQIAVSKFRGSLKELMNDIQNASSTDSKSRLALLKQLELIIDDYEGKLSSVLLNNQRESNASQQHSEPTGGGDDEEKKDDEDEPEKNSEMECEDDDKHLVVDADAAVSSSATIRKEETFKTLTSFLLRDIYNSRKSTDSILKLPRKLYDHIKIIMMDPNTESEEHTYAYLQQKMRSVINQWCSARLETPNLVRIGYMKDDKEEWRTEKNMVERKFSGESMYSVSSWGDDTLNFQEDNKHFQAATVENGQSSNDSDPIPVVPLNSSEESMIEEEVLREYLPVSISADDGDGKQDRIKTSPKRSLGISDENDSPTKKQRKTGFEYDGCVSPKGITTKHNITHPNEELPPIVTPMADRTTKSSAIGKDNLLPKPPMFFNRAA